MRVAGIVYTPEFVERGYNNRAAVPEHPQWFAHYAAMSAAARDRFAPRARPALRPGPEGDARPVRARRRRARGTFVFIHGGYWRALDKGDFSFVARAVRRAGHRGRRRQLRPVPGRVDRDDRRRVPARAGVGRARRRARTARAPSEVVVGGHSAGGHLAAMMFATDWAARRARAAADSPAASRFRACTISRRWCMFSFNADLKLDAAEAARLSPVHLGAARRRRRC